MHGCGRYDGRGWCLLLTRISHPSVVLDFQVDLGLGLIEWGIKMDWPAPYNEEDKPKWLRQGPYLPCNCEQCFFCKNGKTSGITHKPKIRFRENLVPRGHSAQREQVAIHSQRCKSCYEKKKQEHPSWKSRAIVKKCKKGTLGCKACNEVVCEYCWPTYIHTVST